MTPEMVRRVEFLRDAAAAGYSARWAAGELGLSISLVDATCRNHGIKLARLGGINRVQARKRNGTERFALRSAPDEGILECDDFLPDVGEV